MSKFKTGNRVRCGSDVGTVLDGEVDSDGCIPVKWDAGDGLDEGMAYSVTPPTHLELLEPPTVQRWVFDTELRQVEPEEAYVDASGFVQWHAEPDKYDPGVVPVLGDPCREIEVAP